MLSGAPKSTKTRHLVFKLLERQSKFECRLALELDGLNWFSPVLIRLEKSNTMLGSLRTQKKKERSELR